MTNNKFGIDISRLGNGTIDYENRKYLGKEKTIARYTEDGIVTNVVIVDGYDNNLKCFGLMIDKVDRNDDNMSAMATRIRELVRKRKTAKEIGIDINKKPPYVSQIMMLYRINTKTKKVEN